VLKSDFVMITKNDINLVYALQGLFANREFINRLIIVDGSQDDNARIMVEKILPEVEITYVKDVQGNRATARQKGMELVETPLFAFVDSDAQLPKNWYRKTVEFFKSEAVGAVWGCALPVDPTRKRYYLAMARFHRKTPLQLTAERGKIRGMLHDTLIRTEAVEDIEMPPYLHVMEDHYIRKHIENKGYIWVSTDKVYCWHHQPDVSFNGSFLDAYYGWKMNVYSKKWYLEHVSLFLGKFGYLAIATRNKKVMKQELIKEKAFILAILKIMTEKWLAPLSF
jgi:glycosyltransferase involved in cell wall biosynthesis